MVCLVLELVGPCVVLGFSVGMEAFDASTQSCGGKNTQKNCTKKVPNDLDNHDGVKTHLEPDILECEVKQTMCSSVVTNCVTLGNSLELSGPPISYLSLGYINITPWYIELFKC